jgi:hypothetical protein
MIQYFGIAIPLTAAALFGRREKKQSIVQTVDCGVVLPVLPQRLSQS